MANVKPRINYDSPWPTKLKALKQNDVLLIEKNELSYKQVQSLVSNMNYRWKGKLLFRVDGNADTDSLVTCMHRGHHIVKDRRIYGNKKYPAKIAKIKSHKVSATTSTVIAAQREAVRQGTHTPAMAIIEALHGDGSVTVLRAADRAEYDKHMEETAHNMMIVEVKTYILTHTKKRDFSWKDETAATKG
jgi:hypothetical protein